MKVERPTPETVLATIEAMRAVDRQEIFCTRLSDDNTALLAEWQSMRPIVIAEGLFCLDDGTPVGLAGITATGPGTGQVYFWATDDWHRVSFDAHRFVRRVVFPRLVEPAIRRLECRSWTEHHVAHRWLRKLGFAREGLHHAVGKNGEDFYTYAWLKGSNDVLQQQ